MGENGGEESEWQWWAWGMGPMGHGEDFVFTLRV